MKGTPSYAVAAIANRPLPRRTSEQAPMNERSNQAQVFPASRGCQTPPVSVAMTRLVLMTR